MINPGSMGAAGKALISKAVANNYMSAETAQRFTANVEQLANKYGVSADDLVLIMNKESAGLQASIDNGLGCVGLIQFCPGTGQTTIGLNGAQIAALDAAQQTVIGGPVDKFLSEIGLKTASDKSLGGTYMHVLCPVHAGAGPNDPLPAACNPGGQSQMYQLPGGIVTKKSTEAGIRQYAEQVLGSKIAASNPPGVMGDFSTLNNALAPLNSDILNYSITRERCTLPITQLEAISHPGCEITAKTPLLMAGTNLAAASPGFNIPGINQVGGVQGASFIGSAAATEYINPVPYSLDCKSSPPANSPFGPRGEGYHYGIDIADVLGTPIIASRAGIVDVAGPADGFGNLIVIVHADGAETWYGHMKNMYVQRGQSVQAGTHIADIASEGRSSGPHLHFEIRVQGRAVNPLTYAPGIMERRFLNPTCAQIAKK